MEERAVYLSELHSQLHTVDLELTHLEKEIESLLTRQQELLERKVLIEQQIKEQEVDCKPTAGSSVDNQHAVDWSSETFSWTEKVNSALKNVFHIKSFRALQRETINATLSGMDCLLIMPTGGGKSLCFQLPAIVSDGYTLVISPLVSLMEDQILALHDLGIKGSLLNASSTREHVNFVHKEMTDKNGMTKLIYVTPEKIAKSKRFITKLEKSYEAGRLSRIVVDEVHCTSQWGHDFRPDYKYLNIMKRQFPKTPILGLTATATSKVLGDVRKILNLQRGCLVFRASFNRPNLFYEVVIESPGSNSLVNSIANMIKGKFKGQSGIVYCFSKKDAETVGIGLQQSGIRAGCYHADLTQNERTSVHYDWLKDKIQVVVATIAFGMGIDKPNVRFVIHHSMSKSMENFYQESGRAGRDDEPATCVLFFKFADAFRQSTMVFTEQTGLRNLYGMLEYCLDMRVCRRKLIGKHFEARWDPALCNNMCDNCSRMTSGNKVTEKDATKAAIDVVSIVRHAAKIKERITPLKVIDAWLRKGPANLRVATVSAPHFSRATCERIVLKLLLQEVLREEFHFTPYSTISYVVEGPRCKLVTEGKMTVTIDIEDQQTATVEEPKTLTKAKCNSIDTFDILDKNKDERKSSRGGEHLSPSKSRKLSLEALKDDRKKQSSSGKKRKAQESSSPNLKNSLKIKNIPQSSTLSAKERFKEVDGANLIVGENEESTNSHKFKFRKTSSTNVLQGESLQKDA